MFTDQGGLVTFNLAIVMATYTGVDYVFFKFRLSQTFPALVLPMNVCDSDE